MCTGIDPSPPAPLPTLRTAHPYPAHLVLDPVAEAVDMAMKMPVELQPHLLLLAGPNLRFHPLSP